MRKLSMKYIIYKMVKMPFSDDGDMRQWLNGWNGTGQSPGSAPSGPPGVPGTGA